jgi:hypothetical protein
MEPDAHEILMAKLVVSSQRHDHAPPESRSKISALQPQRANSNQIFTEK